jgi:serine/threonine-protein kinase
VDPRFVFAHWSAGLACAQLGRMEEAAGALERAVEYSGGGLTFKAHLGYVYALAGRRAEAEALLAELGESAARRYVPSYYFAVIHLGLGETDQFFTHLGRAFEERSGFLAFLKVEPLFDPVRADPRFAELEGRIGGGPP